MNVLPVIARADELTNERLAAVKHAVRRDLAEAGIGFGIFDADYPAPKDDEHSHPSSNNFVGSLLNGSSAASSSSSPTSPVAPSFLRLPYALISPDCYSHGDGVQRAVVSRHEIVGQYTPVGGHGHGHGHYRATKLVRGRFVRQYRWGFLDVSCFLFLISDECCAMLKRRDMVVVVVGP